jgi:hypothetical protein
MRIGDNGETVLRCHEQRIRLGMLEPRSVDSVLNCVLDPEVIDVPNRQLAEPAVTIQKRPLSPSPFSVKVVAAAT